VLKNFWYAVEFSKDVSTSPRRVTCLGEDLVLYRAPSGRATCMSDLCVHRGAALSAGWTRGDCIVCPYHGWEYAADGACTRIPANKAGVPIPKKARVDSYPVQERYGFVWVFLGDLPEVERPPIPHLGYCEDTSFRPVYGEYRWASNYERILENGCDISHPPFVHSTSFGNPDKPEVPDVEIIETEFGAEATVELEPPAPKGLWGLLNRGKDRPKVKTTTAFYMPNVIKLEINLPLGKLVIYDTNIPIDETHTLVKFVVLRNFFTGAWADRNTLQRTLKIFREDEPIVDEVRPELLPFDLPSELHIKSDGMAIAYRRMRAKALAKGWGIDRHSFAVDGPRRTATVIPSPARREVPELVNAWVMKETPKMLVEAEQLAAKGREETES
jgi:phenylpropionate dioxygenase-like ring-hydroxylating dioxygenase large terminal subunit